NRDVIEFEITPNRPDCLSMIGMARETAATFDRKVHGPLSDSSASDRPSTSADGRCGCGCGCSSAGHPVRIETPNCKRYIARRVENAVIKSSPIWMQLRLMQAGMRPINNIVDITNYVNLEYGNPVHAFDADRLEGDIVVRQAQAGETMVTLDGVERKLDPSMMVIADASKPIAIAGVMGGEDSGIQADTKNILIEVASFDKTSIRQTSKALGLRSEASARFEKGISADWCRIVADRVCELITELGAGEVRPDITDRYPVPQEEVKIPFDPQFIYDRIGIDARCGLDPERELAKLDIRVADGLAHIPHYRLDLRKPIDLVEEVARMYGYDRLPESLPHNESVGRLPRREEVARSVYREMAAQGVSEIQTYSFASPAALDLVRPADEPRVRILNPLGEEFSVLRTSLVPNLLDVVKRNLNRKNTELRFFELGTVFVPGEEKLPNELQRLVIGVTGAEEDFFTLKGIVEELFTNLKIELRYEKDREQSLYHPGKCAALYAEPEHTLIGHIGEINPKLRAQIEIEAPLLVADIDFDAIVRLADDMVIYRAIPTLPAVERDVALMVADDVSSGAIVDVIRRSSGKILESVELFDLYKGPQLGEGVKSLAYALKYRSDKTLTDKEVSKSFDRMVSELEKELGAKLRDK
ncbi:MAG: phenylalanine--tRNA ligase subunit beta, partial [Bacillota bacterium]|nr:phenylalanine--tRNA ligase subunit beta [Bacillota bacterium]